MRQVLGWFLGRRLRFGLGEGEGFDFDLTEALRFVLGEALREHWTWTGAGA